MSLSILFSAWPRWMLPLAYGGPSWSTKVGSASVVGRLASGALLERIPYRGFALVLLVLQGFTLVVLGSTTSV